jgi:hypothetical protein
LKQLGRRLDSLEEAMERAREEKRRRSDRINWCLTAVAWMLYVVAMTTYVVLAATGNLHQH